MPHPIPTITSFAPTSRQEGQTVNIVGNYLAGTSRITIGGALVTTFVVNPDESITATVPAGAVTGKIVIFKDVVAPTNTLIAQSATNLSVIPLLAFSKFGAGITSGQSAQSFNNVVAGVSDIAPSEMHIFPNPAQSSITVRAGLTASGLVRLSLRNALGVVVWTAEVSANTGTFERELDVSNLPAGLYFTELRSGSERLTKRFVKQ